MICLDFEVFMVLTLTMVNCIATSTANHGMSKCFKNSVRNVNSDFEGKQNY